MFYCPFTYSFYEEMINLIIKSGYKICSYHDTFEGKKCILRHDIDFDIEKSLQMAILENKLGVTSTYFVLLKTDFYNPLSKRSIDMLKEIISLGHEVGLHFDEKSYSEDSDVVKTIIEESDILSTALGYKIKTVSMHRPSKKTLESDYVIPGLVNSYSNEYFTEYKYISDSRRRWREDPISTITSESYQKLHILTHSFWWGSEESNLRKDILCFMDKAKTDRVVFLQDNLTDFQSIINANQEEKR